LARAVCGGSDRGICRRSGTAWRSAPKIRVRGPMVGRATRAPQTPPFHHHSPVQPAPPPGRLFWGTDRGPRNEAGYRKEKIRRAGSDGRLPSSTLSSRVAASTIPGGPLQPSPPLLVLDHVLVSSSPTQPPQNVVRARQSHDSRHLSHVRAVPIGTLSNCVPSAVGLDTQCHSHTTRCARGYISPPRIAWRIECRCASNRPKGSIGVDLDTTNGIPDL